MKYCVVRKRGDQRPALRMAARRCGNPLKMMGPVNLRRVRSARGSSFCAWLLVLPEAEGVGGSYGTVRGGVRVVAKCCQVISGLLCAVMSLGKQGAHHLCQMLSYCKMALK